MYVITGWRKNQDTKVIGVYVDKDKDEAYELCASLNYAAGYVAGNGVWNDKTKGCFYCCYYDDKDLYQKGLDFINYKDG